MIIDLGYSKISIKAKKKAKKEKNKSCSNMGFQNKKSIKNKSKKERVIKR